MSDPFADRPFPRGVLLAAAALAVLSLAVAVFVRLTGIGGVNTPVPQPLSERALLFVDRAEGGVAVVDAGSGATVTVLAPGEDGFIRATVRSLARERRAHGIGADVPFRLVHGADGRLLLIDPATGRRIDLIAFGPTNVAAFARLLGAQSGTDSRERRDRDGKPL
ncbi:MAG: photosynthetic complex assembly protein PuhC [Burkholderiaceae bacterium]|nr:photosynthetic complex assembly protein PuhC [Burkholderiaceae bacterium]